MINATNLHLSAVELVVPMLSNDGVERRLSHTPVKLHRIGGGRLRILEVLPATASALPSPGTSPLLEPGLKAVDEANEPLHPGAEIGDLHGKRPWFLRVSPGSVDRAGRRSSPAGDLNRSESGFRGRLATTVALGLAGMLAASAAAGQTLAPNVFADALINGRATAPVPQRAGQASKVLARLQTISGSTEPVSIIAARVTRFTQQPHCGRVQFAFGQPQAHVIFKSFAGQMNVCEDGQPPLRVCPDRLGVLVPAAATCANGRPPVDTDEVAAAVRGAGGMTHDEMLRSWAHQLAKHAPAASGPLTPPGAKINRPEVK
jgi:hypothetical protein